MGWKRSRKVVRCLVLQLVKEFHIPNNARREALDIRNLPLKIPAQHLKEPRAPPALGMQVGDSLLQPPVEQQHLTIDRNRHLDLTAHFHHLQGRKVKDSAQGDWLTSCSAQCQPFSKRHLYLDIYICKIKSYQLSLYFIISYMTDKIDSIIPHASPLWS